MTTGTLPEGAGRAESLPMARAAAASASCSTSTVLNSSKPTVAPTDSRPVCRPVSPEATQDTAKRVFTWSSPASTPSLLATRIRRRLSPYTTLTWRMAEPALRAASSARRSSSTLSALATVSGSTPTSLGAGARTGRSETVRTPPPPPRAAPAAAAAAASRLPRLRSLVWAKPVVSPTTTRIPAPRSRPEARSSTLPSSSRAPVALRSSAKISANSPPLRSAAARTAPTTSSSIRSLSLTSAPSSRNLEQAEGTRVPLGTVAVPSGPCSQVELVVTPADTAPAFASGDVEVLATPRLVALCEQAAAEAASALVGEGQTTVGFRVELTHLAPAAIGTTVVASAGLDGRRVTFNVTVNDKRGLIAAGRMVRVIVDRAAFLEKAG